MDYTVGCQDIRQSYHSAKFSNILTAHDGKRVNAGRSHSFQRPRYGMIDMHERELTVGVHDRAKRARFRAACFHFTRCYYAKEAV